MRKVAIFLLIFVFGLSLRLYHFNWDHNQHLHPDGRFLTMVTLHLDWPSSWYAYFETDKSPLNPFNRGYNFFVYGPLPLWLTKGVAQIFAWSDYNHLVLVGRILAALADSGVLIFLFLISKSIWAPFFYAIMVLPIQLSHFYTVDPFLNFFLWGGFLGMYQYRKSRHWLWLLLAGFSLGLALAAKISAALGVFFLFLLLAWFYRRSWWQLIRAEIIFSLAVLISTYLAAPIYFQGWHLNPSFWQSWQQLRYWSRPDVWFPPGVQWLRRPAWLFPARNMFLWELGIPLSLLFLASLLFWRWWQEELLVVAFFWMLLVFGFQGSQFVKAGRYFLPIYPAIALFLSKFHSRYLWPRCSHFVALVILITFYIIWPLLFMNIYRQPLSRLVASRWMYQHIAPGKTLSCEYWDDCLPLPLEGRSAGQYSQITLNLFSPDSQAKWQHVVQQLSHLDYLILSSNRLWGSIPRVPDRYPYAARFYRLLFTGKLNFQLCQHFANFPGLNWRGKSLITINDRSAEETFTVYDHPEVFIFCRRQPWSPQQYWQLIVAKPR